MDDNLGFDSDSTDGIGFIGNQGGAFDYEPPVITGGKNDFKAGTVTDSQLALFQRRAGASSAGYDAVYLDRFCSG